MNGYDTLRESVDVMKMAKVWALVRYDLVEPANRYM